MNPAWVMVAIALAGIIFQAGFFFSFIGRVKLVEDTVDSHSLSIQALGSRLGPVEKKVDDYSALIPALGGRIDQHEWRITGHDERLHRHDEQLDKLRG